MEINIRGGTKLQKNYADSIIRHSANKMMSNRLITALTINLKMSSSLAEKQGVYGDCIWADCERRPKEFDLQVDSSMKLRPLLETLAHEMVHVKQYARDEMYELSGGKVRFNGKYYSHDVDYWDQPWEIEAHGKERGLFETWIDDNRFSKSKHPWAFENLHTEVK